MIGGHTLQAGHLQQPTLSPCVSSLIHTPFRPCNGPWPLFKRNLHERASKSSPHSAPRAQAAAAAAAGDWHREGQNQEDHGKQASLRERFVKWWLVESPNQHGTEEKHGEQSSKAGKLGPLIARLMSLMQPDGWLIFGACVFMVRALKHVGHTAALKRCECAGCMPSPPRKFSASLTGSWAHIFSPGVCREGTKGLCERMRTCISKHAYIHMRTFTRIPPPTPTPPHTSTRMHAPTHLHM